MQNLSNFTLKICAFYLNLPQLNFLDDIVNVRLLSASNVSVRILSACMNHVTCFSEQL